MGFVQGQIMSNIKSHSIFFLPLEIMKYLVKYSLLKYPAKTLNKLFEQSTCRYINTQAKTQETFFIRSITVHQLKGTCHLAAIAVVTIPVLVSWSIHWNSFAVFQWVAVTWLNEWVVFSVVLSARLRSAILQCYAIVIYYALISVVV